MATFDQVTGRVTREAVRRGLNPRDAIGAAGRVPDVLKSLRTGGAGGKSGLAGMMGGGWGPFIALLLAQFGGQYALGQHHKIASMGIEQEALRGKGEAIDPESMYYQAMLSDYGQQEQMSRMALLQKVMGAGGFGGGQRQLAEGQEMFGGV